MLSLILLACTGEPDAPETVPPPFDLDGARAYWSTRTGGSYGLGVLVISKEADCDSVSEEYLFNDLDNELLQGEGLAFIMEWSDWSGESQDFTGLWMGYGYGQDARRTLTTIAYSSGLLYVLEWGYSFYGSNPESWVAIDSLDGGPRGRFSTPYWQGEFEAADCGSFDTAYDSGWDSDGWDTNGWDTWWDSDWDSDWDSGGDTADDCPQYEGEVYIGLDVGLCSFPNAEAAIVESCGSDYELEVFTIGWTGGADLTFAASANGWTESHPMEVEDFDSDGYWDRIALELEFVDAEDVVEGESTAFTCDAERGTWLTVFTTDGDPVDCRVWGELPELFEDDCTTVWN